MNHKELKQKLFPTKEEREEYERGLQKYTERIKKEPWKHLRKPKRHILKKWLTM